MSISREHCKELSVEKFIKEYEEPNIPVVIDGIPTDENWKNNEYWTIKSLKRLFKNAEFKCGESDSGKTIRMKLKYFYKYMKVCLNLDNYLNKILYTVKFFYHEQTHPGLHLR